jgi:acyl-CoA synthetase (AMP-forming)/AMP-acid ligase II
MNDAVGGARATIPAITAAAAAQFGPQLAIEDGTTRLTYAELAADARTFAAALVATGIEPGDRVAVWAPNGAEWVVALLGLSQAGAVLVPINTRF